MRPKQNSVDIAMEKVRELQAIIFDKDTSPNKLFSKTQEIVKHMEDASIQINENYIEISQKLTAQMNTGRVQK